MPIKSSKPLLARHRLQSKLLEVRDLTPTVKEFIFETNNEFDFYAGQFVTLRFKVDGRIVGRPYSIASSPQLKGRVELCIKLVEDGLVTPTMFKTPAPVMDLSGPMGRFFLSDEHLDNDLVLIGTGTGIAPLKSMIEDLYASGFKNNITLIAGVRYVKEILYEQLWKKFNETNSGFNFHQMVSKPESDSFNGEKGRVGDSLPRFINPSKKQLFIICGLKDMIETVVSILHTHNVSDEHILYEKYD